MRKRLLVSISDIALKELAEIAKDTRTRTGILSIMNEFGIRHMRKKMIEVERKVPQKVLDYFGKYIRLESFRIVPPNVEFRDLILTMVVDSDVRRFIEDLDDWELAAVIVLSQTGRRRRTEAPAQQPARPQASRPTVRPPNETTRAISSPPGPATMPE